MDEPRDFNKIAFFTDVGYTPHPGQARVHDCAASRRILACGVRWGKSRCAAMEGIAAAMMPVKRGMGWVVAPTYDLADKVFREILLIASEKLRHRIVSLQESQWRLQLVNVSGGTSEIRGKSADNPVSLLGEALDWLIVDEATRLKPTICESYLTQRMIYKYGWALLISTPKGKGWFYDLYRRGKRREDPHYVAWNSPTWENPHLQRELVEAERGRLPERVFRQEYGAEFIEGAGQVFRNVREAATGALEEPHGGERYTAGLDLAQVEDFTVLTILDSKGRVAHFDRFHRLDWNLQVGRVKGTVERYNNALTYVDSTGAGEPIFESLRHTGMKCQPYPFTVASKSALVDNLALLLEQRKLTLPGVTLCPELVDELEAFEYSVTEHGNVRTGAPPGYHDDCVISLALAAWPFGRRQQTNQEQMRKVAMAIAGVDKERPEYMFPTWR